MCICVCCVYIIYIFNFRFYGFLFLVQLLSYRPANLFLRQLVIIPIDWAMTMSMIMVVMLIILPNLFHLHHVFHLNHSNVYYHYLFDPILMWIHHLMYWECPTIWKFETKIKKNQFSIEWSLYTKLFPYPALFWCDILTPNIARTFWISLFFQADNGVGCMQINWTWHWIAGTA